MVTINGIEFGKGIPKICIPIVEKTHENILAEAAKIKGTKCQVVEWRIDFFEEVFDAEVVVKLLPKLKIAIGEDKILLVTFRTATEGGQLHIEAKEYESLLSKVIESKSADLVDVEMFIGDELVRRLVSKANENECFIIASNHDFEKTPECDEIVRRLIKMKELGADISKIAVMPNSMEDVTKLLMATAIMKDKYSDITTVTMSMGGKGAISRVSGEIFGSAMTFGIIDKPSAPGQIQVDKLEQIMNNISEL